MQWVRTAVRCAFEAAAPAAPIPAATPAAGAGAAAPTAPNMSVMYARLSMWWPADPAATPTRA